jgi:hypothetical protein
MYSSQTRLLQEHLALLSLVPRCGPDSLALVFRNIKVLLLHIVLEQTANPAPLEAWCILHEEGRTELDRMLYFYARGLMEHYNYSFIQLRGLVDRVLIESVVLK